VALDGDTLVVGDPSATTLEGASAGCVSVFVRSGTTWSVQATLTAPTGTAGDAFGTAVAIEGNRVVVGSLYSDAYAFNGGAVYVFERTGSAWDAGLLLPALTVDADDYHGIAVAVSGDTIAAGASDDDGAVTPNSGAVRVFVKSGAVWSQQAKLIATDQGAGDSMGRSLALSGDTLLAGADAAYAPGSYSGAAYVFTRSGATWSQQAKLTPSDTGPNIRFGFGLAVAGDRAIVGARSATAGVVPEAGAAYVFSRSGTAWSQEQKLVASDPASSDEFGYSIGFDGSKAVVGADYQSNANGAYAGASYVFESAAATSITIKTSATSVRTGNIPILAGKVTPNGMVGKIIVVYVKKPGKAYWSYSSNRGVYMLYGNAVWQYKYYFKPGMTKGYYYFRAAVPASAGYLASGSSTISIRLR